MKGIILALFAIFILSDKTTSQICNCSKNLDSLIKGVEHNYVGFFDKVKDNNIEYPALKDSLLRRSTTAEQYDCFLLLKKYIQYFQDPHMTISIGSLKGASIDTNAIRGIFKRFKHIPFSEESFKKKLDKHGTDGIEGIWQNASIKYRVAIIKDTLQSNSYLGLVLGGDDLKALSLINAKGKQEVQVGNNPVTVRNYIFIKGEYKGKQLKIDHQDIDYIESVKNYAVFHCGAVKHIASMSLKEIELKLPGNEFVRIHNSCIVHLSRVIAVEGNTVLLSVVQGEPARLTIGTTYKARFMDLINL